MAFDALYANFAPDRVEGAARHRRTGSLLVAAFLCALTLAVAGLFLFDRLKPAIPSYVQSFLLADIPSGAMPHFSISNSMDSDESADEGDAGLSDGEENDRPIGNDGEGRLSRQLEHSSRNESGVVLANGQRLLDIDYDLNVEGLRPGDIEVGKAVSLNGRRVGTINVSIDQNSQLHLSSADLARLLPDNVHARFRDQGEFVTFDTLRSNGVDIRYDPVSDMLKIQT